MQKLKVIDAKEKRRYVINKWMIAFLLLAAAGAWENYFMISRWWAIRQAMYNGNNRMAWQLLGRGLVDPND